MKRVFYSNQKQRLVSLILAFLTLVVSSCSKDPNPPAESTPLTSAFKEQVVTIKIAILDQGNIKLAKVQKMPLPEMIQVMCHIGVDENRTARVGAIADGRIVSVLANIGDYVKQGQRLASLRSHEVDVARSDFAKSQAEFKRRQAGLEFARNAHSRAEKLYKLKAASVEEVQRAKAELENAEAAVTAARADIVRIEEQLHHLGLSPESAMEEYGQAKDKKGGGYEEDELIPVISPIDGTILKRLISPGTVVTPSNDLFILSDLGSLWLTAEVPEKNLSLLKIGRTVSFEVQAYPHESFPARITQIGDSLDPDTRTVQMRCRIDNLHQKLKPEMYATIRFELGEALEALAIPIASLQDVNGQTTVFVRIHEEQYRPSPVQLGRRSGNYFEVLKGLKAGETIVADGSFLLKSELLKQSMSEE